MFLSLQHAFNIFMVETCSLKTTMGFSGVYSDPSVSRHVNPAQLITFWVYIYYVQIKTCWYKRYSTFWTEDPQVQHVSFTTTEISYLLGLGAGQPQGAAWVLTPLFLCQTDPAHTRTGQGYSFSTAKAFFFLLAVAKATSWKENTLIILTLWFYQVILISVGYFCGDLFSCGSSLTLLLGEQLISHRSSD